MRATFADTGVAMGVATGVATAISGAATWKTKFWPTSMPFGTAMAISWPLTLVTIDSPAATVAVTLISVLMMSSEVP